MPKKILPSIFDPETAHENATEADAPSFVIDLTARVLGALIANHLVNYEDDPVGNLIDIERVIAEAINSSIATLDLAELIQAHKARNRRRGVSHDE